MRILYVASNPPKENDLLLEQEITILEGVAARSPRACVQFTFLPRLPIERLPSEIARVKPDILHISSHGSSCGLELATGWDLGTTLKADALKAFVSIETPPRLIVLRACNSAAMADELTMDCVAMAIGTTAEVSTGSSRESVRLLYERLFSGQSVQEAFNAFKSMIETINNQGASAKLSVARGVQATHEFFRASPQIVARCKTFKPNNRGEYKFWIGAIGCPDDTHQVVFFTDDEEFITKDNLEVDLCEVVRTVAARGTVWTEDKWYSYGQVRLFACGVTAGGEHFTASSSLTDALLRYQRIVAREESTSFPESLIAAVKTLTSLDGSELGSALAESRARSSPKKASSIKKYNSIRKKERSNR